MSKVESGQPASKKLKMAGSYHLSTCIMAVLLITGASRVLLSLVYLDERAFVVVQEPYVMPTKSRALKRRDSAKAEWKHADADGDSERALNGLIAKFKRHEVDAAPLTKEKDFERNAQKSETVNNVLAAQMISEFHIRLSKLKSTWLHNELKFWEDGLRGCPNFGKDLYLLSIVNSERAREMQREAIRSTWGALRTADGENVTRVFVVGQQTKYGTDESLVQKIKTEDRKYGDVIGVDVFEPPNLTTVSTFRVLAGFKWVLLNCPMVKYVFVGPDDLFVHQVNMVKYLKLMNSPRDLYLGRVRKDDRPERDPKKKNFVGTDDYRSENYPKYCVGGAGFVVSINFLRDAYLKSVSMANKTKNFPLGDVYMGVLALGLKVRPKYKATFLRRGGDADYCDLRDTITLGGFNSEQKLTSVWRNHSAVVQHCPNPIPNGTEIEQWTDQTNNREYFDTVFKLFHNPKKACWKNPQTGRAPYLLALVSSTPEHFELRAAIRETWAAPDYMARTNSQALFVLGKSPGMSSAMQHALSQEARSNHDIIQGDFLESFHNLTLKVILGLKWVSANCRQASFVYKGDDDMLVNFERITAHLRSLPSNQSQRLFLGHMMETSRVVRAPSKYRVLRSQYPFRFFPPYFSGGGYIMSSGVVQDMNKMTLTTRLIPIDDAYAGILAARCKKPVLLSTASSKKFITTGSRKDACYLRDAFNIHGFKKTSVMRQTWADFRDTTKTCDELKTKRKNKVPKDDHKMKSIEGFRRGV